MKKLIQKLLPILLITSQVFAFAGFGAYGDYDLLKYPEGSDYNNDGTLGVIHTGFDNAAGFGLMFYVDALPIIDFEVDIEFVGNLYKFTPVIGSQKMVDSEGEMPWGRISTYMTLRKEIIGVSVPFLAKVQLYGGLGFNKHSVLPVMDLEMFESAFPSSANLESTLDQDFGSDEIAQKLVDYMLEKSDKISGFHLQAGAQGKLLFLNAFINARYTIAKDIIPGKSGYPSLWMGFALGI